MPDVAVEAGAVLLRKVHPSQVVPDNEGGWKVASGAFAGKEVRPGVRAFSVFARGRLISAGLPDEAILEPAEADTKSVACVSVDFVRELDLDAFYRPEGAGPTRDAHAEVEGQLSGSRRTRLAAEASRNWVVFHRPPDE